MIDNRLKNDDMVSEIPSQGASIRDPVFRGALETGQPETGQENFEIQFLGVLGKPEKRRPAEKKIRNPIFRGAPETGEPETG